jgi:hypothetical protein
VLVRARSQLVAVKRRTDQLLEMSERIEAAEGADRGRPALERQLLAMLLVEPPPGGKRRRLGVDDQPVEVEEQREDPLPPTRRWTIDLPLRTWRPTSLCRDNRCARR